MYAAISINVFVGVFVVVVFWLKKVCFIMFCISTVSLRAVLAPLFGRLKKYWDGTKPNQLKKYNEVIVIAI